jgi:hypothetical protein
MPFGDRHLEKPVQDAADTPGLPGGFLGFFDVGQDPVFSR